MDGRNPIHVALDASTLGVRVVPCDNEGKEWAKEHTWNLDAEMEWAAEEHCNWGNLGKDVEFVVEAGVERVYQKYPRTSTCCRVSYWACV